MCLADVPHRRLTKPARVCELFFDGEQRPRARRAAPRSVCCAPLRCAALALPTGAPLPAWRCWAAVHGPAEPPPARTQRAACTCPGRRPVGCRESLLKLEVVAEGTLNAIAFWFDLHLDDCETLTNGALGLLFCHAICLPHRLDGLGRMKS